MTTLVVAAHPDDEVLGCGATIAKWANEGEKVYILIMAEGVTSRDKVRDTELRKEELSLLSNSAHRAGRLLGAISVKLLSLPDNRLDTIDRLQIIKEIEKEIELLKPQTVITHHIGDLSIDHRIVHDAVVTACRPQPGNSVLRILAFEVPSSTEWQTEGSKIEFKPNWIEDVSKTLEIKIEALKIYESEIRDWPHPRSLENVRNLAHWRGSSFGCEAAEAFMLLRNINPFI